MVVHTTGGCNTAANNTATNLPLQVHLMQQGVVAYVLSHDVLLGRGAPIMKNPGNVRFRQLVQMHKADYVGTWQQHVKDKIARKIMNQIHGRGGRFLRPMHHKQQDVERRSTRLPSDRYRKAAWVNVDEATSIEKVKQALRSKRSRRPITDELGIVLELKEGSIQGQEQPLIAPNDGVHESATVNEPQSNMMDSSLLGAVFQQPMIAGATFHPVPHPDLSMLWPNPYDYQQQLHLLNALLLQQYRLYQHTSEQHNIVAAALLQRLMQPPSNTSVHVPGLVNVSTQDALFLLQGRAGISVDASHSALVSQTRPNFVSNVIMDHRLYLDNTDNSSSYQSDMAAPEGQPMPYAPLLQKRDQDHIATDK